MKPRRHRIAAGVVALVLVGLGLTGCAGKGGESTAAVATSAAPGTEASGPDASTASGGTVAQGSGTPTTTLAGTVRVDFDFPKGEARPIAETDADITEPTKVLALVVDKLSYRGLVCGFSFHGDAPASPVTIRLHGRTPNGAFDSGKLAVSWESTDGQGVTTPSASNGGWNFTSDASPDRVRAGWVVQLGGVNPGEGQAAIPTEAACELESESGFVPENGPVGYWAGYAAG